MHDLFISYAHRDDVPPDGAEKGWVTIFVTNLLNEVTRKSGRETILWMDGRLDANDQVTPTLIDAVRNSRTLVLFLSPSYQSSRWCQTELITFLKANQPEKNKERVFIVEVLPVPRESLHERLQELTPFQLWKKDSLKDKPWSLGYPVPIPTAEEDRPYYRKINELAHLISDHLGKAASGINAAAGQIIKPSAVQIQEPVATPSKPVIWVAEPTEDLINHWEELGTAIRQSGAELRPVGPETYDRGSEQTFANLVRKDIQQAQLLVQLLSKVQGRQIKDRNATYTALQNALAKEWAQQNQWSFLEWRASDIVLDQITDEAYRQLLTGAIACDFEEFRKRVVNTILSLITSPPPPRSGRVGLAASPAEAEKTPPAICVNANHQDKDLSLGITEILEDLGADALSAPDPSPGRASPDFLDELDKVIEASQGVIIVYGRTNPAWVQAQYLRAKKILAQRRQGIWGALLDGPPRDKPPHGVASRSLMKLDCRDGLKRDSLARFVDTLR